MVAAAPSWNSVQLRKFKANTPVRLEVYDSGVLVYKKQVWTDGSGGGYVKLRNNEGVFLDLHAGQLVKAFYPYGSGQKSLRVADITIDLFDATTDIAGGTAPVSTTVEVRGSLPQLGTRVHMTAATDVNGPTG